jgi:hypothetical protein
MGSSNGRMLKNYHQMAIKSIFKDQECLKPPFGKGDLGGFQAVIKSPLTPL